jgi:hypothetical protein
MKKPSLDYHPLATIIRLVLEGFESFRFSKRAQENVWRAFVEQIISGSSATNVYEAASEHTFIPDFFNGRTIAFARCS